MCLGSRPEEALLAPRLGVVVTRPAEATVAALSRRGDPLTKSHAFAGPGVEAPGWAPVGVVAARGGGLLAALLVVGAPVVLLLVLAASREGGSSEERRGSTGLLFILQPQFLEEKLMASGGEGEGLLPGDVVGDRRVDLVDAAQKVEDEVALEDGLANVAQFVGLRLHADAVVVDGGIPLNHRVELVIEEDGTRRFVRLEHVVDGLPQRACRLLIVGHGEVEDGVGGGAVHPSADAEVSLLPGFVGGARGGGGVEVAQQAKLPAHGAESRRPLGEVGGLQLEDHGDVQLDIGSGEGADDRGRSSPEGAAGGRGEVGGSAHGKRRWGGCAGGRGGRWREAGKSDQDPAL